jgi:DNA-binding XRE family transcriptional regulator
MMKKWFSLIDTFLYAIQRKIQEKRLTKMKKEVLSLRSSMGKRFKTLRNHLNLTQKEMANKLGITFTTISTLELERQLPSLKIIIGYINIFRVSPLWILTGRGEMFIKEKDQELSQKEYFKKAFPNVPTDPDVIDLIENMSVPIIKNAMIVKALELKSMYKSHILEYEKEKARGSIS